ncbi:hypothetical protein WL67_07700 [Burkholderia ubonensis]|nr:hypothetical protein WL66_08655 [Burkholderia ubonensis]KWD59411.1 hypothetical protein WL67_07700 [Burkholderia ubonensis]
MHTDVSPTTTLGQQAKSCVPSCPPGATYTQVRDVAACARPDFPIEWPQRIERDQQIFQFTGTCGACRRSNCYGKLLRLKASSLAQCNREVVLRVRRQYGVLSAASSRDVLRKIVEKIQDSDEAVGAVVHITL